MWALARLLDCVCSDDKTDDEEQERNRKRYQAFNLPWRSDPLHKLMLFLDDYHDFTVRVSLKGQPGISARERKRDANAPDSRLAVPHGLPIDCYSEEWLGTLSDQALEDLDIQVTPALPNLIKAASLVQM